jgi:hypothetical protein
MRNGITSRGLSILLLLLSSCTTREATKSSTAASDSTAMNAPAVMDSTGMTRSTPAWLTSSDIAAPQLSREEIMALAPKEIRLQDLGFSPPPVLPDTTGLKNKAKVRRKWAEALMDYNSGHIEKVRSHLAEAREFAPLVKDPDPLWPFRFRNLEAGAIFSTSPPGETGRIFGEIAEPNRENVFDVGYEWVMAMDDLRQGNGKEAVARLRFISRSPHKISMEARRILALLAPEAMRDSTNG